MSLFSFSGKLKDTYLMNYSQHLLEWCLWGKWSCYRPLMKGDRECTNAYITYVGEVSDRFRKFTDYTHSVRCCK